MRGYTDDWMDVAMMFFIACAGLAMLTIVAFLIWAMVTGHVS